MLSIKRCLPKDDLTLFNSLILSLSLILPPRQFRDGKKAIPTLTGKFNTGISS